MRVNNTGGDLYVGRNDSVGTGLVTTGGIAYSGIINSQNTHPLQFAVNNSVVMTLENGGNIGIGTTNPDSRLHVISEEIGTGANKGIRLSNYNESKEYSFRTGITGAENTTLSIYDETSGTDRIVILTDGKTGIGTTAPSTKLHVFGELTVQADADSSILLGNAGTNASKIYAGAGDALYVGGNNSTQLYFNADGASIIFSNDQLLKSATYVSGFAGEG